VERRPPGREDHDSLNLYDVPGLAHYELVRAMRIDGGSTELEVGEIDVLDHLALELKGLRRAASKEPFHLGAYYGYDQAARAFGLAAEALIYDELAATHRFERLAVDQLDWALGDNPWGVSYVIGAGTRWPHCPITRSRTSTEATTERRPS
jgi:endoglucanase